MLRTPHRAHVLCLKIRRSQIILTLSSIDGSHLDDETEGRHRVQNTLPHSPQVRFLEMKENLVPHMSQVTAEGELFSLSELL